MSAARTAGADTRAELVIEPLHEVEDFRACEDVQRRAWGFRSDLDVVPVTQMVAVTKAGGLVLGARRAGSIVGFCYSFLGRDAHGDIHYSHMTAVLPEIKSEGVGGRLKWAQRAAVLDQGIDRIVWTYDPLQSLNGYFNFSKLGVLVDTYWENLYGETGSALHQGMPTDRFRAEWRLVSERVRRRARGEEGALSREVSADPDAFPTVLEAAGHGVDAAPGEPRLEAAERRLTVQIPGSIQELKEARPDRALAWRLATREVFQHYLARGWIVRECVRTGEAAPRTLYLLERA